MYLISVVLGIIPKTTLIKYIVIFNQISKLILTTCRWWSGGAMVLGKLQVPGRPANLD